MAVATRGRDRLRVAMTNSLSNLSRKARACEVCLPHLAHGVRPVFQVSAKARILIAGQAPGSRVHASGVPFDDPSGERLRDWMGLGRESFYNPDQVAILPMGFCYPGKGKSGDLPPRPECAAARREQLLSQLTQVELTLVIGQYAQAYHLSTVKRSVTENVQSWQKYWPKRVPLPHPSPRNIRWFLQNPWFESELIPALQQKISEILHR